MPNPLKDENSPYLLQHAENPVQWYPWKKEALDKAIREDKPIFLSIGYTACHWCHVMEQESFMDEHVARFLNDHFISIKVDREERPDLDDLYMASVVAMTGQGGWPMSVFLTPDLRPFYGGTYFPPVPRHGMPSFLEVLSGIQQAWQTDRENIENIATQGIQHLRETSSWGKTENRDIEKENLEKAVNELIKHYDWQDGGWGRAPKFPQPMVIDFLLAQSKDNPKALEVAIHALNRMQRGGMFDVVGGGFHRYSTDRFWLVPHFEKMLYDNAQLARNYLHAYLITGDISYRRTCTETLNFILHELTSPQGGFFSSLDADSDGEEGKFYLWSPPELEIFLQDADLTRIFSITYPIPPNCNFEGKIVLQRLRSSIDCARELGISVDKYHQALDNIHQQLLNARNSRIRPLTDDKVLASWNAFAIQAFAEAGFYLDRQDYLDAARKNADFILKNLFSNGQLMRTWRNGSARIEAFLEDYAALSIALLTLYQFDNHLFWFSSASQLTAEMVVLFQDPAGGFFDSARDRSDLPTLPKNPQDNATPSGNALAAHALLLLAALDKELIPTTKIKELVATFQEAAGRYPTAFGYWLQVMAFAQENDQQIALLWPENETEKVKPWLSLLATIYNPHRIIVGSPSPMPPDIPALLHERKLLNNKITAYVCNNFLCQSPTNEIEVFKNQLGQGASIDPQSPIHPERI